MNAITSIHVERGGPELQDRAEIFRLDDRIVIAVTVVAGGIAGGAEAAETLIQNVRDSFAQLTTPNLCRQLLHQVDSLLAGGRDSGETTGIIAVVSPKLVFGASVGDSGARLYGSEKVMDLTPARLTKPFIGSGGAHVSEFGGAMNGTLVVATDGLWKYANPEKIAAKVSSTSPDKLASELTNLARLRSGGLPDDIAIVTCRFAPAAAAASD